MSAKEVRRRELQSYERADGSCVFTDWFDALDAIAASKVTKALAKLERGLGDLKPVGEGVSELRINFGPGYRVYFGQDRDVLVILLCGGTKKRQQDDINQATTLWAEYKVRKHGQTKTIKT